jgi:hypothetical protein
MGKKLFFTVFLGLVASIFFVTTAYADIAFDYGASIRLRQEIWDNVIDLGTSQADRNFFRLRMSLWGKADFTKDIGAYAKLTTEPKYYLGPYRFNDKKVEIDEIVFDNLYFKANNIFGLPVDVKIGRQDFLGPDMYGEGFIFLDGTPGDGSRTFYFNAAKIKWRIAGKHSLDFLLISDPRTDIYLPSVHSAVSGSSGYYNNKKVLTASMEKAAAVYGNFKLIESLSVEPYYVYKTEDPVGTNPKLKLNTVGARAVFNLNNWTLRGEFAHQFGSYDGGRDRDANGGYFFFGRKYDNVALKPSFDLGYVYLSGNKNPQSKTDSHTGWDPLFSRAPFWNELIIYTLISETANDGGPIPGYWTNLHLLMAKFKMQFSQKTDLTLTYQYLLADQKTSGLNTAVYSNNGKERGHLPTAMLNHKFTKQLDGFLQLEYFIPGNFYSDNARNATFFRWQLQYKL